jgi:hypothetical protein
VTVDVAFGLNPSSDDVKAVAVVLPQGLVGDPNAADRCSLANFNADTCPASSKVGTTSASVTATVIPAVLEIPQDAPGDVYNLQPQGGEPARLGVVLRPRAVNAVDLPKVFLQSTVRVGPDTNYGLATEFDGLPRTSGPFDIRLNSMQLVLNGQGPRGPFLTNPTACSQATTVARVRSYDEPTAARTAGSSFTPTGCDKVPFSPHLAGSMGGQGTTAPPTSPTVIAAVSLDRGSANPSRVSVELPRAIGVNVNASAIPCPPAEFAAGTCPDSSLIGSAAAYTPLLPAPLVGPARYLKTAEGGLGVGVDFGQPVPLKLIGIVGLREGIVNTFDGIPDLPLSRFELTVNGGDRGLLANAMDLCLPSAVRTAKAEITAHSGATANLTADFVPVGCQPANPGSNSTQSGGEGRPSAAVGLNFKRGRGTLTSRFRAGKDGPALTRARMRMPKGLSMSKRRLSVRADGKKVSRKRIHFRKGQLDIRLARTARLISLRWSAVKPSRGLARRLPRRPRLTFATRVYDATPRNTPLTLVIRPAVSRR